jgi:3-dehydroquinate dehydratase II
MHIVIINGPNLNLIGKRQPEIYGSISFETYIPELKNKYIDHDITYHQSNHEGVLIDWLHMYGFTADGILLNAGGFTHTSIALADAVNSITTPVIEVHISDIKKREPFRHHSFLENVCVHTIMGHGLVGYDMALQYIIEQKIALK